MSLRTLAAAAAVMSLAAAPVAAQDTARTAAPVTEDSELGGEMGWLVPVAVIVALVVGIILIADSDDSISA